MCVFVLHEFVLPVGTLIKWNYLQEQALFWKKKSMEYKVEVVSLNYICFYFQNLKKKLFQAFLKEIQFKLILWRFGETDPRNDSLSIDKKNLDFSGNRYSHKKVNRYLRCDMSIIKYQYLEESRLSLSNSVSSGQKRSYQWRQNALSKEKESSCNGVVRIFLKFIHN